ncbi:hypothetical protein [Lentzea sp. NPDC004782]|uniref:hypothetical protein n=1 Tax=Lentzea sp. NPDC004782 TaxID=3154458 RepID=UPI0033B498C5
MVLSRSTDRGRLDEANVVVLIAPRPVPAGDGRSGVAHRRPDPVNAAALSITRAGVRRQRGVNAAT